MEIFYYILVLVLGFFLGLCTASVLIAFKEAEIKHREIDKTTTGFIVNQKK